MNYTNLGLKIEIVNRYERNTVQFWVFEDLPDGKKNLNIDEKGNLVKIEIDIQSAITDDLKPFLEIPRHFANAFMIAVTNYNSNNGIKSKDESLIEGKLQSTELHLNDMRDISKKLIDQICKLNNP